MLIDASPLPLAFALALTFTGEVKLCGTVGALACSAFGASRAPVSEPDPLAFAFACGFGSLTGAVGDASGAVGAAFFTESSDPVRSPAASPFAAPLTPGNEPLALPAVFMLPAITFVAELADTSGTRLVVALPYAHPWNWLGLPSAPVRPAIVAAGIRQALSAGWQPRRPGPAFTMALDEA